MLQMRARLVLVILAALGVGLVWWLIPKDAPSTPPSAPSGAQDAPASPVRAQAHALAVLRQWDDQRAAAYAAGNLAALKSLYEPGSPAGRRDLTVLRTYRERGLRVEQMETQVLELRVLSATDDRLELVVTDRLSRAIAVGEAGSWRLPRDAASSQRVVFVRREGEWVVTRVTALDAQSRRADSSTSVTVGSRNS